MSTSAQPQLLALHVTDLELANLFCGRDNRQGLFVAPCGTLTVLPRYTTLQRSDNYTLSEEVVAACPRLAQMFSLRRPSDTPAPLRVAPSSKPGTPAGANSLPSASAVLQYVLNNPDKPCDLPGCEGWRKEYDRELRALPGDCSQCDRNTVLMRFINQYTPAVDAYLKANPDYRLQS